jgi:hypothetical protein
MLTIVFLFQVLFYTFFFFPPTSDPQFRLSLICIQKIGYVPLDPRFLVIYLHEYLRQQCLIYSHNSRAEIRRGN